jgi:hypothetical protein
MADIGLNNLAHALAGICTDPDCEIHNPEVGYSEEVVSLTDLAFFYAGATTAVNLIANANPQGKDLDIEDYIAEAIQITLAEIRDQHITVKP